MSGDLLRVLIQYLGRAARRERASGNESGATGLGLIAFGIVTLPIPILGLPLIIAGVWKLCRK